MRALEMRAMEIEDAILARAMQIIQSRNVPKIARDVFKNTALEVRKDQELKSRTIAPGPIAEDIVEESDARKAFQARLVAPWKPIQVRLRVLLQDAWDESFPTLTTVKES
ncbi:hypothetical protein H0H92_015222, partial [Tricholoma furcatifolium]